MNFKKIFIKLFFSFISFPLVFAGCNKYENPNDLKHLGNWINKNLTPGNVMYAFTQFANTKYPNGPPPSKSPYWNNPLPGTFGSGSFNSDFLVVQKFPTNSTNSDDDSFIPYFGWLSLDMNKNCINFTAWFKDTSSHIKNYIFAYFQVNFSSITSSSSNSLSLTTVYYPYSNPNPPVYNSTNYEWINGFPDIPKPAQWWN
ncbi:hypothetical protein [Mycoplasma sp. SG1]|uniref:hypothetical protein n=1 Tax=Mycoplasma sp. SG1 TaxID=2810348 RepID=UPI0020247251|nr:hypothetical protein [Mycoplasma sp. SG1]URM52938.1 hypothetical protein JRW51_01155 [Mycoplasma sp. SG1]